MKINNLVAIRMLLALNPKLTVGQTGLLILQLKQFGK